ncbi:MAG: toxic anion resistance protein [Clostridia bacterium]|nr:toxic anion resistance protein [Clostridia bacterium]
MITTETKEPVINLTLDPFGTAITEVAESGEQPEVISENLNKLVSMNLTPEEMEAVNSFSAQIDITNTANIIHFGAQAQQKVADFSDTALQSVKTQQLGDAGQAVTELIDQLEGFNMAIENVNSGFASKLFRNTKRKIKNLTVKYDDVNANVDRIVTTLESHEVTLTKDVAVLDKLYDTNLTYFKELSMYILAGRKKLDEERATTLVELKNKAELSGLPEDAQKANDFASMCDRFEKKIYDLELSRTVSIQMAPQIRLIQNNDTLMTEKIQSTIVNTIPLWKSQMIIMLGLAHTEDALKAEQAVTDMTNALLKKNAEKLHQSTVAVAKENERGIIDIETLTATNRELISTLDEVRQVRQEGRAKRAAAEGELARIEGELKAKLLELAN